MLVLLLALVSWLVWPSTCDSLVVSTAAKVTAKVHAMATAMAAMAATSAHLYCLERLSFPSLRLMLRTTAWSSSLLISNFPSALSSWFIIVLEGMRESRRPVGGKETEAVVGWGARGVRNGDDASAHAEGGRDAEKSK